MQASIESKVDTINTTNFQETVVSDHYLLLNVAIKPFLHSQQEYNWTRTSYWLLKLAGRLLEMSIIQLFWYENSLTMSESKMMHSISGKASIESKVDTINTTNFQETVVSDHYLLLNVAIKPFLFHNKNTTCNAYFPMEMQLKYPKNSVCLADMKSPATAHT